MADIAIIGCGPVGATLANLLGRHGLQVDVFEKQPTPFGLPRAIHFDGEAMRVFQAAGLAKEVLPATVGGRGMLFKDKHDKVLIDWSRDQALGPMGWHESYRFHQPLLEEALCDGMDQLPNVKLHRSFEVTGLEQGDDQVTLSFSNGQTRTARYVVAADGAASTVRDMLNVTVDDLGYREKWLVVDLLLSKPRDDLGDYSIQFCDEENPATYVRGIGDWRRWEMRLDPTTPDDVTDEFIWEKLARWITPEDAQLERKAVYEFRSCVSETWRKGRCFLAGDAAHQMPPFMGQGMCAGIRDASNLAWKLRRVLSGEVAPAHANDLMDSYGTERQKNVRQFIELTVRLGKLINQTASGQAPSGKMKSIWPSLGKGIWKNDGIGGELAPQPVLPDGRKADDVAGQGFYVLARGTFEACVPVFEAQWERLEGTEFAGALIRPDGYALCGVRTGEDVVRALSEFGFSQVEAP